MAGGYRGLGSGRQAAAACRKAQKDSHWPHVTNDTTHSDVHVRAQPVRSAPAGRRGGRYRPVPVASAPRFDVAVAGQGLIGLAATLAFARRGLRVVAFDAVGAGHALSSSTGRSRSIRCAYAEPPYVQLAVDAIAGWRRLEQEQGRRILHLTGQVDMGPRAVLDGLHAGMAAAGVESGHLSPEELRTTFPELVPAPASDVLHHPDGGTVLADEGLVALAAAAVRLGAELAAPEPVRTLSGDTGHVRLETARRTIEAGLVVLAAGPWTGPLAAQAGLQLPLTPAVAQVTYLDAPALLERPGLAEWQIDPDGRGVYGHPVPGTGYKLAFDAAGSEPWQPHAPAWAPDPAEQAEIQEWARSRLPGLAAPIIRSERHPWTMTPDGNFIIDRRGPVAVACGCSGHAFKFGPALGELVADVALGEAPPELFSLGREAMSMAPVEAATPISR